MEAQAMVKVTESNFDAAAAETDPGYGQLFAVLMRRRFWLLGVLCSVLSVATILTLIAKPTYQSSMQLLIEPNYEGKSEKGAEPESEFADSNVEIDYATQINVMRSPVLLQRAADLLSSEYPDITVKDIQKYLVLTPIVEEKVNTKIIQVVYTDNDPIKTEKVLEAVNTIYQIYNREQQEQRLRKGLKFINEQIPSVRKLVDQSEGKLEQFRKNNNLIDPEQQATAIAQTLNTLEQERQSIRAQLKATQASYNALQQQIARSPQNALVSSRLSQSSRYQSLLNEFQRTEMALAQRRVVFTDADPNVQKLLALRQSQLALLQSEVGRVVGGVPAQLNSKGEGLLQEGQLSGIDLNLTSQLVEAQTNLRALSARDSSMAQTQQQLRSQLNRFPVLLAEYNRLLPLVQINRDKLQQLLKAQQELSLEIARGGFDWQTLEEPQLGLQIGPNIKLNLLLGLVVGLMLGGGAAFLREMFDDSVHSSEELEKQIALPLLGMTPELPQDKDSQPIVNLPFGKPQIMAPWTIQVTNWPPAWESLDLIYKNIQLLNSVSSFKSLMVTSALAGEGKSTLALGLALSAARLHQRVLLIDADLRRPNLHKLVNLPNEQGLSTLLTTDANVPIQSSIQSSGSHIDVVTAGPMPADPPNLLSSQRMRELMAGFEQTYDLVLVDAPPVLGLVDAILTASFCSGVVLVSRIGKVTKTELTQATAMLSKLNVIGVVANESSGSSNEYYPYTREYEVVLQESAAK
jgi:capsular exopolysaccharide synthesis family protein